MDFKEMQKKLYKLGYSNNIKAEIEKEIKSIKADCQSLREYQAVVIDDMPHSTTVQDTIGNKASKIIDIYEKRITELMDKLEKQIIEKNKLLNLISELTIDEQDVLRAKYIDGLRWEYIPGKINISRAKCFYLHKIAVNKLINIWNESVD